MKRIITTFGLIFLAGFSTVQAFPQINFSVSPSVGLQNTEFTIDANDSRNASGNRGGLDFRCQYYNGLDYTPWSVRLVLKFRTDEVGRHRMKCQIRDKETGAIKNTFRDYQVKKDFVRRVRIEPSKSNATVGEAIFFTLIIPTLTGENPDTILSRWDFNSDGVWDTKFSKKKVVSYSYSKQGTITPTAEIKFPNGRVITVRGFAPQRENGVREYDFRNQRLTISSPAVFAPIVNVTPGTSGFTQKTVFKFDASLTRIPRLGWIEWSVDGQQWLRFPDKKKASFSFSSPGKHEVRTRVCVGKSSPKCAETTTSVNVIAEPLDFSARIGLRNTTNPIISRVNVNGNIQNYVPVEVGDNIRFTAIPVKYGNLGTLLYRWDFQSDGDWDTDFSRNNFTETNFDRLGEFNVMVQIKSADGIFVTQTKRVRVNINPKPTIFISHTPAKIFIGERIRSIPRYPSGLNDRVRFDIDNDGVWESDFRGLSSQEWVFATPGKKIVRMQTRDKGGNTTIINKTIQVYDIPEPKARVIISKKYVLAGQSVVFDGSDSTGRNLRYFWDFNSTGMLAEGSWEEIRRGPFRLSRVFREKGEQIISLKVVDERGNGDQIFFSVIVQ